MSAHDQHAAALPVTRANHLPERFGVKLARIGQRRIHLRSGNARRQQRSHSAWAGGHETHTWRKSENGWICYVINSCLRRCSLR